MFGKRQHVVATTTTVIAAGCIVEGSLRVSGMVQVDGTVDGTLSADGHVSVGPDGKILGELRTDQLSIGGTVDGALHVRGHLHVLASGVVKGTAAYASLEVDRGGVMDGSASRVVESALQALPQNTNQAEPLPHVAAS